MFRCEEDAFRTQDPCNTAANYDKEKVRTECGRNGFGAKLANIFSKKFTVTIGDHHNEKHYFQCWTDNMKNRGEPVITSFPKTGKSFVEIEYTLDFERFKYSEYPEELVSSRPVTPPDA